MPLSHPDDVTLILLNYTHTGGEQAARSCGIPTTANPAPTTSARQYGQEDGLRYYRAALEFLIDRYTQPRRFRPGAGGYIIATGQFALLLVQHGRDEDGGLPQTIFRGCALP